MLFRAVIVSGTSWLLSQTHCIPWFPACPWHMLFTFTLSLRKIMRSQYKLQKVCSIKCFIRRLVIIMAFFFLVLSLFQLCFFLVSLLCFSANKHVCFCKIYTKLSFTSFIWGISHTSLFRIHSNAWSTFPNFIKGQQCNNVLLDMGFYSVVRAQVLWLSLSWEDVCPLWSI